eukprot:TRINITY_DN48124_c0_g1_i1.p1 TRINITY_DN48124_c0_g1~~TRINITY_DN48124_c0_g1_i1.p1  ORF type:complete len:195 (-),score=19.95 TRINITY_DN48124_c0_g1_i1:50-574(-)
MAPSDDRYHSVLQLLLEHYAVDVCAVTFYNAVTERWHVRVCSAAQDFPMQVSSESRLFKVLLKRPSSTLILNALESKIVGDDILVRSSPHIRLYAEHPFVGPSGSCLGAVIIADMQPRASLDSAFLHEMATKIQEIVLQAGSEEAATQEFCESCSLPSVASQSFSCGGDVPDVA